MPKFRIVLLSTRSTLYALLHVCFSRALTVCRTETLVQFNSDIFSGKKVNIPESVSCFEEHFRKQFQIRHKKCTHVFP